MVCLRVCNLSETQDTNASSGYGRKKEERSNAINHKYTILMFIFNKIIAQYASFSHNVSPCILCAPATPTNTHQFF